MREFTCDVVVEPQCHFRGDTVIGDRCRIGPGCLIENSTLAVEVEVLYAVLLSAGYGCFSLWRRRRRRALATNNICAIK